MIVRFDGKPVPTMRDLPRIVAETAIDKPVQVEVIRRGKSRMLKIVTGRLEEVSTKPESEAPKQEKARSDDDESYIGLTLQSLSRENRQRFGLGDDVIGAVIVDVERDSAAFEAGIRPGDVVSEIDQRAVGSAKAAVDALKAAKKKRSQFGSGLYPLRGNRALYRRAADRLIKAAKRNLLADSLADRAGRLNRHA